MGARQHKPMSMARVRAEERSMANVKIQKIIKGIRSPPKKSEEYRAKLQKACEEDEVVVLSGQEYAIRKRKSPTPPKQARQPPSITKEAPTITPPPARIPLTASARRPLINKEAPRITAPAKRYQLTNPVIKRDAGSGMKEAPAKLLRRIEPVKKFSTKHHHGWSEVINESVAVPKKLFTCEGTKDKGPNNLELLLARMEKDKQGK